MADPMRLKDLATLFFLLTALVLPALAAAAEERPANEQVIEPQVDRREVKLPKFPSNDFEVGLFVGGYATENFGTSLLYGLRLGYHITEDIFVEGVYGRTRVSDENFRQILPGGIFPQPRETLTYYNLSAGYNVLPGEVFFGKRFRQTFRALPDRRRWQHAFPRAAPPDVERRLGSACVLRGLVRAAGGYARPQIFARSARQAARHEQPRVQLGYDFLLLTGNSA